jgi:hypothetical protein
MEYKIVINQIKRDTDIVPVVVSSNHVQGLTSIPATFFLDENEKAVGMFYGYVNFETFKERYNATLLKNISEG